MPLTLAVAVQDSIVTAGAAIYTRNTSRDIGLVWINFVIALTGLVIYLYPGPVRKAIWRGYANGRFQSVGSAAYPFLISGIAVWVLRYVGMLFYFHLGKHLDWQVRPLWPEVLDGGNAIILLGMGLILISAVREIVWVALMLSCAALTLTILTYCYWWGDVHAVDRLNAVVGTLSLALSSGAAGFQAGSRRWLVFAYGLVLGAYGYFQDLASHAMGIASERVAIWSGWAACKLLWLFLIGIVLAGLEADRRTPAETGVPHAKPE